MPVIKSAIKKLRRDKKVEKANDLFRAAMEKAVKDAEKKPAQKTASVAFSILDKAVKKNIIHKNKAARVKSKLSKLLPKKASASTKTAQAPTKAPAVKKEAKAKAPKKATK